MKKLLSLLLAASIGVSCIDGAYDLDKIETEDVTIGSEGSEFRIPLATVHIRSGEIVDGRNNSLEAMFADADDWLPSVLPNGTEYADLEELRDGRLLDDYFDALLEEMSTDAAKFDRIVAMLWADDTYRTEIQDVLGYETTASEELFRTAFEASYLTDETLQAHLYELARNYFAGLNSIEPLSYEIGRIDLDKSIVDMLVDNLGPMNDELTPNRLYICGEIVNVLPVSAGLRPRFTGSGATIVFGEVAAEAGATNEIAPIRLSETDLRDLVDGMSLDIPFELTKYYPNRGFSDSAQRFPLIIRLILVRTGGLDLDL